MSRARLGTGMGVAEGGHRKENNVDGLLRQGVGMEGRKASHGEGSQSRDHWGGKQGATETGTGETTTQRRKRGLGSD